MHARATPLGERSSSSSSSTLLYHLHVQHLIIAITHMTEEDACKERWKERGRDSFQRAAEQTMAACSLTLTYLVVLDPFRCRINRREDKPFLFYSSRSRLHLFSLRPFKEQTKNDKKRPLFFVERSNLGCYVGADARSRID